MLLARRNQSYNQNWLPSLFNEFFNDDWFPYTTRTAIPALNVVENNQDYQMELAIPGLKREDLNMQIDQDGVLTISMSKNNRKNNSDKERNYLRREFSYQEFQQSYILPDNADRDAISAKVENGILTITVPKLPASQQEPLTRTITIQ